VCLVFILKDCVNVLIFNAVVGGDWTAAEALAWPLQKRQLPSFL
jgi:hypothetical protein